MDASYAPPKPSGVANGIVPESPRGKMTLKNADYEIAVHTVKIQRSGQAINIDEMKEVFSTFWWLLIIGFLQLKRIVLYVLFKLHCLLYKQGTFRYFFLFHFSHSQRHLQDVFFMSFFKMSSSFFHTFRLSVFFLHSKFVYKSEEA